MQIRLYAYLAAGLAAFLPLSSNAQLQTFSANLSGPAESPPNASPGTGFTTVSINPTTHLLQVDVSFSGLVGNTTASHIHAPTTVPGTGTAGVATQTPSFSGFPLGVTSGTYSMAFDMSLTSTWNPSYVTANGGTAAGAESAFVAAMQQGRTYLNIHTNVFTGGEIRGFLLPVAAPESGATASLMMVGLAGLALTAYRFRRA
jgi:hypothetical protein